MPKAFYSADAVATPKKHTPGTPDLIYAASAGDITKVRELVLSGSDVNEADYDNRTSLHLASAEGHFEVVKFLVENGADINAVDRWQSSVLYDAINANAEDITKYLRSKGLSAKNDVGLTKGMCTAARDGDIVKMKKLIDAGVDVNCSDADGRTPLHLACARGAVETVEFLLSNGAKVSVSDSFGNTPLQNAQRGESKSKRDIIRKLLLAGANLGTDAWQLRNSHEFRASLIQSLPLLCERGKWIYAEAWIPTDDETELLPLHETYSDKAWTAKFSSFQQIDASFKPKEGVVGSAWSARSPVWLNEVPYEELRYHRIMIEQIGVVSGLAVPIVYNDRVFSVVLFLGDKERPLTPPEVDSFFSYANGLVASGVLKNEITFEGVTGISPEKMKQIFQILVSTQIFNAKHIYQEVDWFFRMGIPTTYYEMFDGAVIAKHIHCLMAAKKLAQAIEKQEDIYVHTDFEDGSLFICPATYAYSVRVENRIEEMIRNLPEGKSFSLTYLCSLGTVIPHGKYQLSMYIIDSSPYVESHVSDEETNIWKVASGHFLRSKTFEIRARYQELIKDASSQLSPIFRIHHPASDGTTPVTLTFRHSQKSSFLLKFTEALKFQNLKCSRKFIETFANGIVVYSFYLHTTDMTEINRFLHHMQLLCLIPGSSMRGMFLSGELSVEEYAYAASVRKFIYYFLNQPSEEFEVLAKALKNDTLNLGRLSYLQTKLRREAVSLARINDTLIDSASLIHKLFADFEQCCKEKPAFNTKLAEEIKKVTKSDIDSQILTTFLTFNAHIRKTNFWKNNKAALAFSLDPAFVTTSSLYPENPYIIYFVLGQEFQGFHIRFRDISRGGIRVIKSAHRLAFLKNMEGQFAENYDLAHTQNKKNKDIPEFGSKGTVLLNRDAQGRTKTAFQKYIAAIMDLLVIKEGTNVVDHYKKEEILFMGPDENTADMMEWAARYAQTRGYRYWKAFTTGKPPSLGGVPHDTYGMTTRGVHRYVLGCLRKMGLKEEEVTKFQTGGPDGDLGSNECLISRDKTIGLVDGSGVVYDPNGLERSELIRLATNRNMISSFDTSKLSPNGFRVLVTDENVTLPSGELVESGLTFRNEFHLHPLSKADMFVPCGGRPASINLGNVKQFFDKNGKPKYKIIIEGANLFLTQDARLVMENAGVVLYKDASANKGGVTSSSLEVLAAIAMTDSEHKEHMQVSDPNNIPPFYKSYVEEVQERIEQNAELEFECIWSEHLRTGLPRCVLTDKVSEKINELNDDIASSELFHNTELREQIMSLAIPRKLQELIPIDEILRRIPENYARATFAAYLASHFIYKYGLNASEFAFFEFISTEISKAQQKHAKTEEL